MTTVTNGKHTVRIFNLMYVAKSYQKHELKDSEISVYKHLHVYKCIEILTDSPTIASAN